MKKSMITLFGIAALAPAWAQDVAGARMAFQDRQNLAEVPRLIQQFNQLAENQDQIAARLVKVETGSGDSAELRAEIDKLRGEIAELRAAVRRDQDAMRREIVDDLTRRLNGISQQMQQNQAQSLAQIQARAEAALQAAEASAKAAREQADYTKRTASRPAAPAPRASGGAAAKPAAPAYTGPYYEHVAQRLRAAQAPQPDLGIAVHPSPGHFRFFGAGCCGSSAGMISFCPTRSLAALRPGLAARIFGTVVS